MGLIKWFRRRPSGKEMREELEAHIALRAEHDGAGEPAARRRLGNELLTQEEMRSAWIAPAWDILAQDARYTWRTWRRNPGFALAAILVLALGLGSATALFSALDRILFRGLPYPDPGRLVAVGLMAPLDSTEFLLGTDYAQLWRRIPGPFESVTTIAAGAGTCDLTEDRPERLGCLSVEANFLHVLGVRVIAGRDFTPEDDLPGAPRVALIRHGLWMRRFGGDPKAIGRTLNLDGLPVPIAGVLPADFELPNLGAAQVLLPQQLPQRPTQMAFLRGYARLKPGVAPEQAHAALQLLFVEMLKNVPPAFRKEVTLRVRPLRDRQLGHARRAAWLLLGAVGALLLIACVNVTNLLLARLASRQREFAVRAALGAGPGRLARLAFTESLLLALVGGGLGLLIAQALLKIFVSMAPQSIPKIEQASLDGRVLAISAAVSMTAGVLIGLWPAFSVIRAAALHGARATLPIRPRVRFALVTAQIALTLAMLGSATLLLRSLWGLASVSLGFETESVLTASITLNAGKYRAREQQVAFFEQLLDRSSQTPGAQAVALSDSLPPSGPVQSMIFSMIDVEGRPQSRGGTGGMIPWRSVTPRYFETLGIPIVKGRPFNESDRQAAEPTMVLSEALEKRLFPGENALGRRLRPGRGEGPWHVIVGVAKNIRNLGAAAESEPEYYVARRRAPADARRSSFLAVRTTASIATATAYIRQAIADIDPQLPVTIQTMERRVSALSEQSRFTAWLLSLFAVLALVLAATGLSGVAAYMVTQRTRDIGVRMAVGATPGSIVRLVVSEAATWVAAGAFFGLILAWASGRALASLLFRVTTADPVSWILALLVLTLTLAFSVLRPAIRASRIDPATVLRAE